MRTIAIIFGSFFLAIVANADSLEFMPGQGCTALAVGRLATVDGSTMATHGNDCPLCDFRLGLIPRRDYRHGDKMPVYMAKNDYPRRVGGEGDIYARKNLEQGLGLHWDDTAPQGHIEQAEHTYQFVDGSYGVMNEHQLGMGESTCAARLGPGARPVHLGGKALFDIAALSRVALQRCKTARCAIRLMGDLAVKHGFYGGQITDWAPTNSLSPLEGGEALTIIDPEEAWVFNISPDDTGASAVWAAQRVPDDHVTVVRNAFSVGVLDLNNTDYFMASENTFDVAERNGFWKKGDPFDWARIYTLPGGFVINGVPLFDRRKWNIFDRVAPYLNLAPDTAPEDLPFSVKPANPLSESDVFALHRSSFQGTPFDLSKDAIGGPWGDPARAALPLEVKQDPKYAGNFERAVAQTWTSYTIVVQARNWLPSAVGGRIFYGPHDAITSLFVPIYPAARRVPQPLQSGSLNRYNPDAFWWRVCVNANYIARQYSIMLPDLQAAQSHIEQEILDHAGSVETKSVQAKTEEEAKDLLTQFHSQASDYAHKAWTEFFYRLVQQHHDGSIFTPGVNLTLTGTTYPLWFIEAIGPLGDASAKLHNEHPEDFNPDGSPKPEFPVHPQPDFGPPTPKPAATMSKTPAATSKDFFTSKFQAKQRNQLSSSALLTSRSSSQTTSTANTQCDVGTGMSMLQLLAVAGISGFVGLIVGQNQVRRQKPTYGYSKF